MGFQSAEAEGNQTRDTVGNPKTFKLVRLHDVSGVSGEGIVAEGVVFHDGQVVLSWFGKFHSMEVHPTIEQLQRIHGHDGLTQVLWD